jgi:polar amino acid transport system substrate-binding protein
MQNIRARAAAIGVLLLAAIPLAACSSAPADVKPTSEAPASSGILFDELPKRVQDAGFLTFVQYTYPPYYIGDGDEQTGAAVELRDALADVLGVDVKAVTVAGLPALLTGLDSDRFDVALGPIGDTGKRQESNDFVDWVNEYVVFGVQKGNPTSLESLADICGIRLALLAGGSAEAVAVEQSTKCTAEGKEAVELQTYQDLPTMALAVQSDRADALFTSLGPLTYYVTQSAGALELAGLDDPNGFPLLFQGAALKKDSDLTKVIEKAFLQLVEDGTYEEILTSWDLQHNLLDQPGINLAE